jgi:hypothetical protein
MKFNVSNECHVRAEHCSRQSRLTQDTQLKKIWDDLAAEWRVLETAQAGLPVKANPAR